MGYNGISICVINQPRDAAAECRLGVGQGSRRCIAVNNHPAIIPIGILSLPRSATPAASSSDLILAV